MVDLIELLGGFIGNPLVYFALVFVYAVLVAIILPIPIEIVLLPFIGGGNVGLFTAALLAIATGKAVGAWLVFLLGVRVEGIISSWTEGQEFLPMYYRELEKRGLLHGVPFARFRDRIVAEFRRKGLPRGPPIKAFLRSVFLALQKFVRVTGALGLYVLLSIPLMSDTVPIYFYAIFNEEGKAISKRNFILSNFLAGVNRVAVVLILFLTVWPDILR